MYNKISLPYELNEFEPTISKDTMEVHFNTLYTKYVDEYNNTLVKLENARNNNDYSNIKGLERDLSFNSSGVTLHELYFKNLKKEKTYPSNELNKCITDCFGSYHKFKEQFKGASLNIEGSGWCILSYTKPFNRMEIITVEKHQNYTIFNNTPLLVLDIWEHSYFLDHKADRNTYIDSFFELINWEEINNRFHNIK